MTLLDTEKAGKKLVTPLGFARSLDNHQLYHCIHNDVFIEVKFEKRHSWMVTIKYALLDVHPINPEIIYRYSELDVNDILPQAKKLKALFEFLKV